VIDRQSRREIKNNFDKQSRTSQGRKKKQESLSKRISLARFISFTCAVLFIISGLNLPVDSSNIYLITGLCFSLIFCFLIYFHHSLVLKIKETGVHIKISQDSINRMNRTWSKLRELRLPLKYQSHTCTKDLDISGFDTVSASLLKCLGPVYTEQGIYALMSWLYKPGNSQEIKLRQSAVLELEHQLFWRQELDLYGRLLPVPLPDIHPFLQWAESMPWIITRPVFLIITLLLSLLPTLLIVLNLTGFLPPYWIFFVVINLVFFILSGSKCHTCFDRISGTGRAFKKYSRIIRLLSEATYQSDLLNRYQSEFSYDRVSAFRQIKRLDQLITLADARYSSLIYPFLTGLFLWPFVTLIGFEYWQRHAGKHVKKWFDSLGNMEALSSLATLKYENPEWIMPDIDNRYRNINVSNMGHPLIDPGVCITNPVTLVLRDISI